MKTEKYNFTKKQINFINGLLLSDASISKNTCSLKLNTSSYEFAKYVYESLPKEIWCESCILKQERLDKRTNKFYTTYRLYTHTNEIFYELRKKWYSENGKKIIPNDIELNKTVLLSWYLGDGCVLQNYKYKRTNSIKLCTNSFNEYEICKILLPKLKKYNARMMYTELKQPVIIIPRNKCESFLNDIGDCPFSDYSHKWYIYPYKNKKIEIFGVRKTTKEEIEKIIELYKSKKTVTEISKQTDFNTSLIIYYLRKENVYKEKRDKKRYRIEHDGKVNITENLKEYCKNNGMNYTNMLKLCSGKIKKYKNIKIKKI